jgi:predicted RNA-binding protein with RPS1 domain
MFIEFQDKKKKRKGLCHISEVLPCCSRAGAVCRAPQSLCTRQVADGFVADLATTYKVGQNVKAVICKARPRHRGATLLTPTPLVPRAQIDEETGNISLSIKALSKKNRTAAGADADADALAEAAEEDAGSDAGAGSDAEGGAVPPGAAPSLATKAPAAAQKPAQRPAAKPLQTPAAKPAQKPGANQPAAAAAKAAGQARPPGPGTRAQPRSEAPAARLAKGAAGPAAKRAAPAKPAVPAEGGQRAAKRVRPAEEAPAGSERTAAAPAGGKQAEKEKEREKRPAAERRRVPESVFVGALNEVQPALGVAARCALPRVKASPSLPRRPWSGTTGQPSDPACCKRCAASAARLARWS